MVTASQLWSWVLQAGSLAGVASLAWHTWQAWEKSRDRLGLSVSRAGDQTLEVFITFRPKSHHAGLEARVRVIDPPDGKVALLEPTRSESLQTAIRNAMSEMQAGELAKGRLLQWAGDEEGLYRARALVITSAGPDGELRARLRVEIWTTGYPRQLLAITKRVSGMD